MKTCLQCERHVLSSEIDCPFCGVAISCTPVRPAAGAWLLFGALGAVGCGPKADDGGVADDTSGMPSTSGTTADTTVDTSASTSVGTSASTIGTSVGSTDPDTSTGSDDQGDSPGAFYAIAPDGGNSQLECDIWAQDCPRGERCAPVAIGGGSSFDGSRCVPLDPNAAAIGDTCTVEGGPFTGIDNCGRGAMCFDADPETLEGTCVALCEGAPAAPLCEDPDTACAVFDPDVFAVCLAGCDILADDCDPGRVCMTVGESDVCVPA